MDKRYVHAFERQELWRTQLIFSLAAIIQPIWFFITETYFPEQYDFLWPRVLVALMMLTYIPFLDRLPKNRWHRDLVLLPAGVIFSVHGLFMTWLNHWHTHHALGVTLTICVSYTLIATKKAAWVFSAFIAAATAYLWYALPDSHGAVDIFWIFTITALGMLSSYGRLNTLHRLVSAETMVHDQQAVIVNSAKLRALGEMAGGIAHEINTPLATIGVNAEIIEKSLRESSPEAHAAVGRIRDTVDRIAKIIRGMRELVQSDDLDPWEVVRVSAIVNLIKDLGHARLLRDSVHLHVDCPEDFAVRCRPRQIAQLLMNLLNNAFDFLPTGKDSERWIRLEVRRSITQVEIAVLDSGPGVPEGSREKLWQPFFTTKELGRGLGLGLSISRRIAEDHGGTLSYEPDEHTRFILRLPLKEGVVKKSA